MKEDIFLMQLHDEITIHNLLNVIRVPGGWIYQSLSNNNSQSISSVFVPYDNGFQTKY